MSVNITTAFVQQYKDNVIHLSQQKGSRLRGSVRLENSVIGKTHFFERIGASAAVKKTSRHGDTPLIDTPHSRRRVALVDYEWADLVDKPDKVRLLISPESEYAIAGSNAMGRAMDDEIIAAAFGNAYAGEDGGTIVAFPTGTQQIAAGGTDLTLAKLIGINKIFDANEVDQDELRSIAQGADQTEALLNDATITSADYNTVKALVNGDISMFMGLQFIKSQRLDKAGNIRSVLAWARNGLALALGMDVVTRITERADKSYSVQVYLCMTIGSTRVEDEKVIEILCDES